jgi:hypothetical protein
MMSSHPLRRSLPAQPRRDLRRPSGLLQALKAAHSRAKKAKLGIPHSASYAFS